jgi:hypothetical protein
MLVHYYPPFMTIRFPADAILVFGKEFRRFPLRAEVELRARATAAALVHHATRAPILTFEASMKGQEVAGSDFVRGVLLSFSVPQSQIVQQHVSTSTEEEIALTEDWMLKSDCHRLIAITSKYHRQRVHQKLKRSSIAQVHIMCPEDLIPLADSKALLALVAGRTLPRTMRDERLSEQFLRLADKLNFYLPLQWGRHLEIQAGKWLRSK